VLAHPAVAFLIVASTTRINQRLQLAEGLKEFRQFVFH